MTWRAVGWLTNTEAMDLLYVHSNLRLLKHTEAVACTDQCSGKTGCQLLWIWRGSGRGLTLEFDLSTSPGRQWSEQSVKGPFQTARGTVRVGNAYVRVTARHRTVPHKVADICGCVRVRRAIRKCALHSDWAVACAEPHRVQTWGRKYAAVRTIFRRVRLLRSADCSLRNGAAPRVIWTRHYMCWIVRIRAVPCTVWTGQRAINHRRHAVSGLTLRPCVRVTVIILISQNLQLNSHDGDRNE